MAKLVFVIAIAFLVHFLGQTKSEGLEAKLAVAKLPTPLWGSSAVYDGNGSVYIFGG
jgi:hypothetical protein